LAHKEGYSEGRLRRFPSFLIRGKVGLRRKGIYLIISLGENYFPGQGEGKPGVLGYSITIGTLLGNKVPP